MKAHDQGNDHHRFAHVMLFDCPVCRHPLSSTCLGEERTLEVADGHWFKPRCHCGWTGDVVGLNARKHWVESWEPIPKDPEGACDARTDKEHKAVGIH